MLKLSLSGLLIILLLLTGCTEQQQQLSSDLLDSLAGRQNTGLSKQTITAGIREALQIGSARAVAFTSKNNGYWGNQLLRIAMPKKLTKMADTLRSVGFGRQVDQFELAMNRAAERAAAEAKPVFWDAILKMSLPDASGILKGGDNAATDYFRRHTRTILQQRYLPIVKQKMNQVGLYQHYQQLLTLYKALPLVKKPSFNLDNYIVDKGLAGLFSTLANEEQKIRKNPAARTTELLKKVFANNR